MKKSRQAQIELGHLERGTWEHSREGFGLHGSGEGAGGQPVSKEFMKEQEEKFSLKNRYHKSIRQAKTDREYSEKQSKLKEHRERLEHAKIMFDKYQSDSNTAREADYFKKLITELENT